MAHFLVPLSFLISGYLFSFLLLHPVADLGLGLVHTQDMGAVADAVEQGRWQPREVRAGDLAARYGFVPSPQARHHGTQAGPP